MTLRSDNGKVELKRNINGSSGTALGTVNGPDHTRIPGTPRRSR